MYRSGFSIQRLKKIIEETAPASSGGEGMLIVATQTDLPTVSVADGTPAVVRATDTVWIYDVQNGWLNTQVAAPSGATIDDTAPSPSNTYSSNKIESSFSPTSHSHNELHAHVNQAVLDGLTDVSGKLNYNGLAIGSSLTKDYSEHTLAAAALVSIPTNKVNPLVQVTVQESVASVVDDVPPMTSASQAGITISESQVNSAGWEGWRMFDDLGGNTGWATANKPTVSVPHFVSVDFGVSKVVGGFTLLARDTVATNHNPKDFKLQGSTNNSTWVDVYTKTTESFARSEKKTYSFQNSTAYRYYRLLVTQVQDPTTATFVSIAEMELYVSDVSKRQIKDSDQVGVFLSANNIVVQNNSASSKNVHVTIL